MSVPMAINARYTHRRVTGVERYASEISSRLKAPIRHLKPTRPLAPFAGHLWEQTILPWLMRENEILWSPANSSPWIVYRQAVTIHDASVFDHPEWFRPAFTAWTRISWKILAKRAKAIITVSQFSRYRLRHHLGIPDKKIYMIPNGVGKPFEPQSKNAIQEVKQKYNLNQPYYLFVGTLQPRKNLQNLLRAWEIFLSRTFHSTLVVVGAKEPVFANVDRIGNPTRSQFLGYVPDSDLPALYAGACAAILPSLYEGSALAALEAMACGAPVIASNTSSFPEVTGEAALLVNPHDTVEIANALNKIIEDSPFANNLRARGLQRIAQFTWDEAAQKTQTLLENLE